MAYFSFSLAAISSFCLLSRWSSLLWYCAIFSSSCLSAVISCTLSQSFSLYCSTITSYIFFFFSSSSCSLFISSSLNRQSYLSTTAFSLRYSFRAYLSTSFLLSICSCSTLRLFLSISMIAFLSLYFFSAYLWAAAIIYASFQDSAILYSRVRACFSVICWALCLDVQEASIFLRMALIQGSEAMMLSIMACLCACSSLSFRSCSANCSLVSSI